MRVRRLPVALVAILLGAMPAAARAAGAPASTLTAGSAQPAAPHRRPPPRHLREEAAAHILSRTPRPPLNIDCTPAQERAARSDLERAQYRLKCGR